MAAGLTPQVSKQGGEQFFFGLVAIQADQQKTITAFTPQREQFLEYDLTKLVYGVQQFDKRKLGLLTSLPLQGGRVDEQMLALGQRPAPGQFVIDEWSQSFEIVPVDPAGGELPAGLDALAVIHPQHLPPRLQFAIDQFLLGGKPVFLAVDPVSQYFVRQAGQQAMFGTSPPNAASDLPVLLKAYGIAYDPQRVVGDLENATQVQTARGAIERYPLWLSLGRENFNAQTLPLSQLSSVIFVEAGRLAAQPGSTLTFTPLIQTSDRAGDLPGSTLRFAQPDEIARQIIPTGKKTIAALVTGKFKTAFPAGSPTEDKSADADKKTPNSALPAVLKESKTTSTLFVIADTDWLFDEYSVRKYSFFGQTAAEPINDNLALAANIVEYLAGSQDLISIRGKGSSIRPFTVVRRMEAEAQQKYQEKLTGLDSRLSAVQAKLSEIQGRKTEGNRLVATPEVAKAIEDFQKQQAALRGERREIRRALRENIDALENGLLVFNLLAGPLLVGAFGLWFHRRRLQSPSA